MVLRLKGTLLEKLTTLTDGETDVDPGEEGETILRTIHLLQQIRDGLKELKEGDYLEVEGFLEWLEEEIQRAS